VVTPSARLACGASLDYSVQASGWYAYIHDGGYTEEQRDRLAGALMAAQEKEFDALLPDGCYWSPHVPEITGPAGRDLEAALAPLAAGRHDSAIDDVMELACERVTARFAEIERTALGA
jgi:hypothetical protein